MRKVFFERGVVRETKDIICGISFASRCYDKT